MVGYASAFLLRPLGFGGQAALRATADRPLPPPYGLHSPLSNRSNSAHRWVGTRLEAGMKRRDFLAVVGGAAAWAMPAQAQKKLPVIAFLHSGAAAAHANKAHES